MNFFMSERCEGKFKAEKCQEHSGKKLFCCEMCNKEIISNLKLQKRILTNSTEKTFECEVCGKSFTQKINLVMHMCTHTMQKPLECDKNDSEEETKSESDIFEEMLVPVKKEACLPFTCEVCGESYPGKVELLTHLCTDTSSEAFYYEENYENVTDSENLFDDVLISSVTNSTEKTFECEVCGKSFTQKSNLVMHMCTHNIKKPFQFEKDPTKVNENKKILKTLLNPRNNNKFFCSVCKREFKHINKSRFLRHMRTHTGERPYKCSVCPKEFSQSYTLVRHIRTHTGEKPYVCSVCGRPFNQSGALRQHVRIHTGETPYQCSICDKKFTHNGNLVHHVRTHAKK